MSDDIKELKDIEKEFAKNQATADKIEVTVDHDDEESCGTGMGWVPGLILIGIGAFFLLRNFTDFELNNWWALFILIPAFGSLGNFWRIYQTEGRINRDARGSLIGSLVLFFISAIFLFNWSWAVVWPFFLIIGGVGALLSGLLD